MRMLLHTNIFTSRQFCTQTPVHKDSSTQILCTPKAWDTVSFTRKKKWSTYSVNLLTRTHTHTATFNTQPSLHADSYFYLRDRSFLVKNQCLRKGCCIHSFWIFFSGLLHFARKGCQWTNNNNYFRRFLTSAIRTAWSVFLARRMGCCFCI